MSRSAACWAWSIASHRSLLALRCLQMTFWTRARASGCCTTAATSVNSGSTSTFKNPACMHACMSKSPKLLSKACTTHTRPRMQQGARTLQGSHQLRTPLLKHTHASSTRHAAARMHAGTHACVRACKFGAWSYLGAAEFVFPQSVAEVGHRKAQALLLVTLSHNNSPNPKP